MNLQRLDREVVSSGIIVIVGAIITLYSLERYSLGMVSRMGPGMVPFLMGLLLVILGVISLIAALMRDPEPFGHIEWRSLIVVSLAIAVFPLLVQSVGVLPTLFLMTLISTFAKAGSPLKRSLIVSVAVAAIGVGVFVLGLGVPLVLVKGF